VANHPTRLRAVDGQFELTNRERNPVFLALAGVAMIVSATSLLSDLGRTDNFNSWVSLASVICAAAAFSWLFLAIKCPSCGGRPTWFIVSNVPATEWLRALIKDLPDLLEMIRVTVAALAGFLRVACGTRRS
jgi:hypothetical protein